MRRWPLCFAPNRARDVPLLSRACRSSPRPITRPVRSRKSTAETPLGSGPYKVGRYEISTATSNSTGSRTSAGRIFPSTAGSYNFGTVRYECLSRPRRGVRRFYRQELSLSRGIRRADLGHPLRFSRDQETAASSARTCRTTLPSGGQGWFFNTRRDKFKDPRVREAIINAFDFEWTNKTVMYGAYAAHGSPFQNSDMVAPGCRRPKSWSCSSRSAGKCRTRCSGEPFVPPVSDGSGGPGAAAQGPEQLLQDTKLHPSRMASGWMPNGEIFTDRIPARRAVVRSRITRPSSKISASARHRSQHPVDRRRAISRAGGGLRFRHRRSMRLSMSPTPGDSCGRTSRRRPPRPRARTIWPG